MFPSDRDAYVFIDEDEVTDGHLHNFNKYDFSYVSPVGTEYAYDSIMHYGPYSFNKDPNKSRDSSSSFLQVDLFSFSTKSHQEEHHKCYLSYYV